MKSRRLFVIKYKGLLTKPTYMSCVLKVGWCPDHRAVYSPPRALRLHLRLVAACEPL